MRKNKVEYEMSTIFVLERPQRAKAMNEQMLIYDSRITIVGAAASNTTGRAVCPREVGVVAVA